MGEAPYPHKFHVDTQLPEFITKFTGIEDGVVDTANKVCVAGRLMSKRASGKNLYFYDLRANGVKIQIMADKGQATEYDFEKMNTSTRRGDIVGIRGYPGKSKKGELSIFPCHLEVLTPCLHMLPGFSGLKDQETRYRKRFLDLIMNPEVSEIFKMRSNIIRTIRRYLDDQDFTEVGLHGTDDAAVAHPPHSPGLTGPHYLVKCRPVTQRHVTPHFLSAVRPCDVATA